jgi:arsenite-transporting ATPase
MNPMRLIFYLGKGGVGKSVISLATAVRSAELGFKTLVVSTDVAHNLADFLDIPVGSKPTPVVENLWAQEVSAFADLEDSWKATQEEISKNILKNQLGDIVAEDVAAFPGLDEIGSLSNITQEIKSDNFDRIIVDTAATGSTIRLLSMPDSFRWYTDYLQKLADNRLVKIARPVAEMFLKKPAQIQAAFAEREADANYLRTILRNSDISSYRVVIQPERVAVREAKRIISYLNIYDYPIDCLVMNRLLIENGEHNSLIARQRRETEYLDQWGPESQPYTLQTVPDYSAEIVGLSVLSSLARDCFGAEDPGKIFTHGPSQEVIADQDGHYLLRIPMPFMDVGDVRLRQKGNELFIITGNFKRELILPAILNQHVAAKARQTEGMLNIIFKQRNGR